MRSSYHTQTPPTSSSRTSTLVHCCVTEDTDYQYCGSSSHSHHEYVCKYPWAACGEPPLNASRELQSSSYSSNVCRIQLTVPQVGRINIISVLRVLLILRTVTDYHVTKTSTAAVSLILTSVGSMESTPNSLLGNRQSLASILHDNAATKVLSITRVCDRWPSRPPAKPPFVCVLIYSNRKSWVPLQHHVQNIFEQIHFGARWCCT